MTYTGFHFGAYFWHHEYKPNVLAVRRLIENFSFQYNFGSVVKYREPHRKSKEGVIVNQAYSSINGGTIKVYLINDKWINESFIKIEY